MQGSVETTSRPGFSRTLKAYIALTKPRVLELLLVTTVPVMILAHGGVPNLWLVLATVIGGAMSAGSAAAFNMYLDRDIDAHMHRTEKRPIVTGECLAAGRARVRVGARGGIHRLALRHDELARRRAQRRRDLLLRRDLHDHPEASHRAEHRVGRHRRMLPRPDRMDRRHGLARLDAVHPVPPRVPVDAAALLAALDEVQGRLPGGRHPDARRDARRAAGRAPGHPLRVGDGRLVAAAHPGRGHGFRLQRVGGRARRLVHRGVARAVQPCRAR